ncbi:MAG: hypothetical protein WCA81_04735 [Rhizomicrobium sp.]|jgi:hypothetical protein
MFPVSQAPRRYTIELSAVMLLYMATLFGRVYALKQIGDPALATIVKLSPIVPVCLAALAIYRFYRSVDEYQRLRLLKMFAVSAGLTLVVIISWSFAEDVGAPPLSAYGVLGIMSGIYIVTALLWRADNMMDRSGPLKQLAIAVVVGGAIATAYRFGAEAESWPIIPFVLLVPTLAFVIFLGLRMSGGKAS